MADAAKPFAMKDIKRILVPVDFSGCSEAAFDYAIFLASHFSASIDVFHAWTAPAYVSPYLAVRVNSTPDGPETLEAIARTEAGRRMKEFLDKAKIPDNVQVGWRIEFGVESEVILDAAKDYDVVVMGTHGRSGLAHLFMGSVAEKVVRAASVPVVTVRSETKKET